MIHLSPITHISMMDFPHQFHETQNISRGKHSSNCCQPEGQTEEIDGRGRRRTISKIGEWIEEKKKRKRRRRRGRKKVKRGRKIEEVF